MRSVKISSVRYRLQVKTHIQLRSRVLTLSQWRGKSQVVGEIAQVMRCMDLELDETAPQPFIRMDMPSYLLVRCNTQSLLLFFINISMFLNSFSSCQSST